jgi:hypothetical protein
MPAQQWRTKAMTTTVVGGETINMTDFAPARAAMHEDNRAVALQIELRDGRAVVLNVWKDGYVSVALWQGTGEHDLINNDSEDDYPVEAFREWCERAVGKRPADNPEAERKADADTTPRRCIR